MISAVDHHFLLDPSVHLDRVVDADPEHHREATDGHDRQWDAEVARDSERPDDTDDDDAEREEAPAHAEEHEQDQRHDPDGDRPEGEHPAGEVVVDVLQQHRRTGGDDRRVVELQRLGPVLYEHGCLALVFDRRVPTEARHELGVAIGREVREERLADVPLVVMEQELHVRGVVERAFRDRDRVDPGQGLGGVLVAGRRTLHAGVPGQAGDEDLARDSLGRVTGRAADQGVVELHRRERRDHVGDLWVGAQLLLDALPLRDVLRGEELRDVVTRLHGHEREHRLTAEELLVLDVVLVDLVAAVQVAVLAGGELQVRDAVAQAHGEDRAGREHDDPVLAEVQPEPAPELVHRLPPSRDGSWLNPDATVRGGCRPTRAFSP